MTRQQRTKLTQLEGCDLSPALWAAAFVKEMLALPDDHELTTKQAYWIDSLYFFYSYQIKVTWSPILWMPFDVPPPIRPVKTRTIKRQYTRRIR